MFTFQWTDEAREDFGNLRKYDQQRIVKAMEENLEHQPNIETSNRKCLYPNELAEWELRVGDFRVFYDVDEANELVKVEAIGRKIRERVMIRGQEFKL